MAKSSGGALALALASLVVAQAPGAVQAQPPGPPAAAPYQPPGPQPPGYAPGYPYGSADVSPPMDYHPEHRGEDFSPGAREEDRRYAAAVQHWAARACVDERDQNRVAGAAIGGVFGALVGSAAAGRHDRGGGAVVGGILGAIAGSAIGASQTSPGCPPGYVVRPGAPPFSPPRFRSGFVYVAPPDYRPWIWANERWVYRPYPYHRYWYRHESRRPDHGPH